MVVFSLWLFVFWFLLLSPNSERVQLFLKKFKYKGTFFSVAEQSAKHKQIYSITSVCIFFTCV